MFKIKLTERLRTHLVPIRLNDRELAALNELCVMQGLNKNQVFIQALRLYQARAKGSVKVQSTSPPVGIGDIGL